ncbi:MAG TPA: hypothetical protein VGA99_08565 [bacterium]
MFQIISIISFLAVIAFVVYRDKGSFLQSKASDTVRDLLDAVGIVTENLTDDWRRLILFLLRVSFAALLITGFIPVLIGSAVSGFVLILHLLAAAVFAIGLMTISLLQAHQQRFNGSDWQSLRHLIEKKSVTKKLQAQILVLANKITFWLILLLALPLLGSILLSMYPLFGTDGQRVLLLWHGYSALLLFIVVVVRLYLIKSGDR